MSDYRHDILGPNGLSASSGTFTMKHTCDQGGGVSSDFTTAIVSVLLSDTISTEQLDIDNVVRFEDEYAVIGTAQQVNGSTPQDYIVILYKGLLEILDDYNVITEISGNIEKNEDKYVVTGDCTITVKTLRVV